MSEPDNKIEFKFKPSALEDWKKFAVGSMIASNEFCKEYFCKNMKMSELVVHELQKVSVNSLIFRNFLDELSAVVEVDDNGALILLEEDIANIWKCLLSISESKKYLLEASISLEMH